MVTFLDLASNVPEISLNTTNSSEDSGQAYLTTVDGGFGIVSFGVDTIQEASAHCCIGGTFSLSFDGELVDVTVDLENTNDTARSDYLREGLEDAIDPGMYYSYKRTLVEVNYSRSTKHCSCVRPHMVFDIPCGCAQ